MQLSTTNPVRVRVWPALADREPLLGPQAIPGAAEVRTVDELAGLAEAVRLRGRGGAAFPFATKLRAVAEQARRSGSAPVVVLNGEEGEPASAKDRVLMTQSPMLALDGLRLVASALGAERAYAYVSDPMARAGLAKAAVLAPGEIRIVAAPAGYVTGEESAVVRWLSGGPAKPTNKPPRPFESGVDGRPTLVSNVETLAQLARLVRRARAGLDAEPTMLLTVGTDRGEHTVVEVPAEVSLEDVLAWLGIEPGETLLGGFFGRFLSDEGRQRPLRDLASRAHPDLLGCGIVLVLHETCPVTLVAQVLAYLDRENAEQCGPCFKGIPAMAAVADRLAAGTATAADVDRLAGWGTSLRGRGACGTLDAACGLVGGLLEQRSLTVARHLDAPCVRCTARPERPPATGFAVPWPNDLQEER